MLIAPYPQNEETRLRFLRSLNVLDTPAEEALDRITRELAERLQVPIATVTLVDANRQWFKSKVGLDVCETSRDVSFCSHALYADALLVVEDALRDARFRDNPMVQDEPHVRFYAGVPLRGKQGLVMGTLCALDTRPRQLDAEQVTLLLELAARAERHLLERSAGAGAESGTAPDGSSPPTGAAMRGAFQAAPFGLAVVDAEGRVAAVNRALCALSGHTETALLGGHAQALWAGEDGASLDLAACARAGGFHQAVLNVQEGSGSRVWLNAVVGDREDAAAAVVVTVVARDGGGSPWPWQGA